MQKQHAEAMPRNQQAGAEVAERIYRDYQASYPDGGPTLPDFIAGIGRNVSVTNDARGPHRAFWSYESVLEGADTPVPNRFLARACGESRGLQVLEDTPAGHQLNSYALDNRHVLEGLVEHFKFDAEELDTVHGQAWDALSDRFAEATEGLAIPFAADVTRDSVLGKTEMPALLKKANVGKEGVKFATPLPPHDHLPKEIHELISADPFRCQLFKDDYAFTKSPQSFAGALAAIDVPESHKVAHKQSVDRLARANSYGELKLKAQASAFLPGVTLPTSVTQAATRSRGGHGVLNPVTAELAPNAGGFER
ncbi:hypothetical protein ACIPW5_25365 [Streptomyces sp. NPDC090077]|uniref:hypothetical protein n=1 Tax=Streptomyces sp. NPDC090077 TaxID=3365938 RepID=UPI003820A8CB